MSNINTQGTRLRSVRVDLDNELAALDALPPELRYLVQEAPVNISALDVRDLLGEWGMVATARYLLNIFQDMAPGWAPMRNRRAAAR